LADVYFRQLHPEPATVEIADHIAGLQLARRASPQRPFTVANFISSIDGRVAYQGRSRALGDDGDLAVFRALRREVDAVLVGTGTLRAERYGRLVGDADARERRRRRGLSPEPLACVVTRSGQVPFDIPLFAEPEAKIVIFSGVEIDLDGVAAEVQVVVLDPGEPLFTAALRRLRTRHGVGALLCEGGPGVFGALVAQGAVDQLFLTVACKLVGGAENPSILGGPELPEVAELSLEGVLERHGYLFLRYAVAS
jgi:riboflavin biosynthesis pyrimidine reductase